MGYSTGALGVNTGMMSMDSTNYTSVQNYIGSEALAEYLGGLHQPEVDAELTRRYGRDDLSGLLSQVPGFTKAIKYAQEYFHFEKDFIHGIIYATTAGGAAFGTFTLQAAAKAAISNTASPFIATTDTDVIVPQEKDVLLLPGRIEVIVTAVDKAAGTFVAYTVDGSNLPAVIATDQIIIKGNVEKEGSGEVGETRNSKLILYKNNMAIHRRPNKVTGSEMGNKIYVDVQGRDGKMGKFWHYESFADEYHRFKNELEMMHFDGKKITNTALANLSGFETVQKTEGLVETIESYGISADYGASLTLSDISGITRKLDKFKGDKTNLWLQGYDFRESLNALWRTGDGLTDGANPTPGRIKFSSTDGIEDLAINLDFERVKMQNFTFLVKQTNALSDPTTLGAEGLGYSSMAISIPTGSTVAYNDLNDAGSKTTVKSIQLNYKVEDSGISRLYKEWATGGVGGYSTSGEDFMTIWQLAECGLETFAINRFSLLYTTA